MGGLATDCTDFMDLLLKSMLAQGRFSVAQGSLLRAQSSLFIAQRRLLLAQGNLLVAQCNLLLAQRRLLLAQRRLLVAQCSLLFAQSRLLRAQGSLLVAEGLLFCVRDCSGKPFCNRKAWNVKPDGAIDFSHSFEMTMRRNAKKRIKNIPHPTGRDFLFKARPV